MNGQGTDYDPANPSHKLVTFDAMGRLSSGPPELCSGDLLFAPGIAASESPQYAAYVVSADPQPWGPETRVRIITAPAFSALPRLGLQESSPAR